MLKSGVCDCVGLFGGVVADSCFCPGLCNLVWWITGLCQRHMAGWGRLCLAEILLSGRRAGQGWTWLLFKTYLHVSTGIFRLLDVHMASSMPPRDSLTRLTTLSGLRQTESLPVSTSLHLVFLSLLVDHASTNHNHCDRLWQLLIIFWFIVWFTKCQKIVTNVHHKSPKAKPRKY